MFLIIIVCLFITWFVLTHLTKLKSDDLMYQYVIGGRIGNILLETRVKTLNDLFISQKNHYFIVNGRAIAHTLDQLFLMTDKIIFNIFNAITFTILVLTIYSYKKSKEINNILLLSIIMGFWFCTGNVDRGLVWQTGSFNYLWMICFSAVFAKPYIDCYLDKKGILKYNNYLFLIIYFLFSIIAGWGHEMINPTIIFGLMVYFIFKFKNKIHLEKFEIIGFVGYVIGTCLLLFAPGNFYRIGLVNTGETLGKFNYFFKLVFAFLRNTYYLISYTTPLLIGAGISLGFKAINEKKKVNYFIIYWILLFLFSVYSICILLGYATSCLILPVCVMLTIIAINFDNLKIETKYMYITIALLFILILFVTQVSATIYLMLKYGKNINHIFQIVS